MMRAFLYVFLPIILASCSAAQKYHQRQALDEAAQKNSVLMTLDHLGTRLPKGDIFYAGVSAPLFVNGSRFRVKSHEVLYKGIEVEKKSGREIHVVRARVTFVQGKKKERLEIKYTFFADARAKKKVRMRFIHGFPDSKYLSREDPLKEFRKSRWLKVIKKRDVKKGMPEKAFLLSWGEPVTMQSATTSFGTKKVLGYRGYKVTLLNGKVDSWRRVRK